MSKCKRALSLLLVVLMMLSLLPVSALADDGRDTYSIVIKYVFRDSDETAAPSWTATVSKGSNLDIDQTSPVVLGYEPDQKAIVESLTNIQNDVTYTVRYSPALVNFTVNHHRQNLNDDKYDVDIPVETETKAGYTQSAVGKLAKSYTGFTALLYDETTKIAADGSTVIDIYYDRNYYLLSVDLDGGYGAEPVYARYGADVSISNPTKPGYTFSGWDKAVPSTMPAENMTLTAKWTAGNSAKVTVVIWGENANNEQYSYIESFETSGKPDEKFSYNHQSGFACYGLSANATPSTPDTEALKYFTKLGLENNTIYYFDDNGSNSDGDKYYLYYYGQFYLYSDKPSNNIGDQLDKTKCDEGLGHRTDYFYKYKAKITCGNSHSEVMDSSLWKLVKSETPTVAADGSTVVNVYYDRIEKNLHFRKTNSSKDDYGTITAKWGANIDSEYKAVLNKANNNSFWSEKSNGNQPYTNYIGIMPTTDKTYYNSGKSGDEGVMSYYFEKVDGGYPETAGFTVTGVGGFGVTEEDYYEFEGFTFSSDDSTGIGSSCKGATFYYIRNSYSLVFYNGTAKEKEITVKYEKGLGGYNYTPTMPTNLYEVGSHVFAGWYLNPECTGDEYKLNEHTMPAANLILYAKWVPISHTVRTFLTEDDLGGTPRNSFTVPHGSAVENPPAKPTNGNYTFVGWFYKENGVEKAFDFSMAITKDLDLYAKWSSNVLVAYTIKYQYEGTDIADVTTGSALAGTSRTFDAKGGDDLYTAYRDGYFPETSSHNMQMSIIDGENVYIFKYKKLPAVPYTVKYVDAETGEELINAKTVSDNSKAVVTEKYVVISGHMPDAAYKRLVVSADEPEKNVIIFYYTKDMKHALVTVNHWIQTPDGKSYLEYKTKTFTGNINDKYKEDALTISGFTYNQTPANPLEGHAPLQSGTLTENGLELNLYYDRISYKYVVKHVDADTNELIEAETTASARYGSTVYGSLKNFDGYTPADEKTTQKQLVITDNEDTNVITFYYYQCFYVGHVQSGTLDRTDKLRVATNKNFNLTAQVTKGYLYGGAFDAATCGKSDVHIFSGSENALGFTPEKGKTYYIWEVDQKYLTPKTASVWRHVDGKETITRVYLMTAVDRLLYQEVGFNMISNNNSPNPCERDRENVAYGLVDVMKNGKLSHQFYVLDGYLNMTSSGEAKEHDDGYIGMYKLSDNEFNDLKTTPVIYQPYWITLDGIKVTGTQQRTCTYNNPPARMVGCVNNNAVSSCAPVASASTRSLKFIASCSYDADPNGVEIPEETGFTVTVNDNGSTYNITANKGDDITGKLSYAGADGKLFAGWFTDENCTVPADLSNVQEDMTVYAKYVSDSLLQFKFVQQRLFGSKVYMFTSIDSTDFKDVGFVVNGVQTSADYIGSKYSGYSARLLFGSSVGKDAKLVVGSSSTKGMSKGDTLTVTPYWVTADGTTVYGTARMLTYGRFGTLG